MPEDNRVKRSYLSNRIINGKDAILKEEAFEYIKKKGYIFVNNKRAIPLDKAIKKLKEEGFKIIPRKIISSVTTLTTIFICMGALNLLII